MKLLAFAILLVTVCCLEGAIVKREAEVQASSQFPDFGATLREYADSLSQHFASVGLTEEKIEQIKAQAQTFSAQALEQLKPLPEHARQTLNQFVESLKGLIQRGSSS